jgi:predicted kinase
MRRLVVIRGNSGAGKTTLAHKVRDAVLERSLATRVTVVEQDRSLIPTVARFGLERGYDVIVEGILGRPKYGAMLRELMAEAESAHAFYLDVAFDETLRRHATKPNAADFGEADMRAWWRQDDLLGVPGETVLAGTLTLDESVDVVLGQLSL